MDLTTTMSVDESCRSHLPVPKPTRRSIWSSARTKRNLIWHGCVDLLRRAGLRPTQQRQVLGSLLFAKGGRHVTAAMLHAEAIAAGIHLSLATVYNTLNQFTDAGLLRQIGVDGSISYFDTNPTGHHHFFVDRRKQAARRSRAWRVDRPAAGAAARLRDRGRRHRRPSAPEAGLIRRVAFATLSRLRQSAISRKAAILHWLR